MGISENIKQLRKIYDLSQKDLAKIAGVSDKAVSTWENGLKEPRMGAIEKIANHFGIKKSNIIENDGLNQIKEETVVELQANPYNGLTEEEIAKVESYKAYLLSQRNKKENSAMGE